MYLLHAVENPQRNLFKSFTALLTSLIPLADRLCTGNDVLFKIVGYGKKLILLRVFISNTVTKRHSRRPDCFCSGILHNPVHHDKRNVKCRHILLRHIKESGKFKRTLRPAFFHKFFNLLPGRDISLPFLTVIMPDQQRNIIIDNNQVFNCTILQIQLLINRKLGLHNLSDQGSVLA